MVTAPPMTIHIAVTTHDLGAEASALPIMADEWATLNEDAHLNYYLEWRELVSRFEDVYNLAMQGRLTTAQWEEYAQVVATLQRYRPIITNLDLDFPSYLVTETVDNPMPYQTAASLQ